MITPQQKIWKIKLIDDLCFYVLAYDSAGAVTKILTEPTIEPHDIFTIEHVTYEDAQNILVDTDMGGGTIETLLDEAIWGETIDEEDMFLITCFEVVADLTLVKDVSNNS